MAQIDYPEAVRGLVLQLKRLPGIGAKSAERIAIWLLQRGGEVVTPLSQALVAAGELVRPCEVCGFFMNRGEDCSVCEAVDRDAAQLCVVEQPTDVLPLERSGAFRGFYHVLGGRISPLEHVGPEDLRIDGLVRRLKEGHFSEVILALGSDVEGEATANYLVDVLSATNVSVTRLAQGLPVGGGLDSADELTLLRALQGRRALSPPREGQGGG